MCTEQTGETATVTLIMVWLSGSEPFPYQEAPGSKSCSGATQGSYFQCLIDLVCSNLLLLASVGGEAWLKTWSVGYH